MNVIRWSKGLVGVLLFIGLVTPVLAKVFYSKNEAIELAFGKDSQVEQLSLFPDANQVAKIEELSKTKLESGLFTFYVGKSGARITGYAAIETSTVRTKPETLMIVLTADGELQKIFMLAFHEPPEYQPADRWFEQFYRRPLADMEFNKGIDGITGATLSSRSIVASVRKVMAMYQVMVKNE